LAFSQGAGTVEKPFGLGKVKKEKKKFKQVPREKRKREGPRGS